MLKTQVSAWKPGSGSLTAFERGFKAIFGEPPMHEAFIVHVKTCGVATVTATSPCRSCQRRTRRQLSPCPSPIRDSSTGASVCSCCASSSRGPKLKMTCVLQMNAPPDELALDQLSKKLGEQRFFNQCLTLQGSSRDGGFIADQAQHPNQTHIEAHTRTGRLYLPY